MKLYLSSYKLGNKTEFLKKWIEENDNSIVLITSARDAKEQNDIEKQKIKDNIKMLENIGFKVTKISLKKYFNKKTELKEILKQYHAFCVIGGNVFVLRQAMKLSGLDEYIKEISNEEEYLYIGYSAGSCVLSPTLKCLDLVDEPINPYNDEPVIYDGINLINYVFVPHYKSNHKESERIDKAIIELNKNKIKYKTFSDGDVILEDTKKEKILEKCLPNYLEEDLKKLKEGIKNNVSYLDCLINELQGSINSAFIDGDITEEQCDYLYRKYIRMEELKW